MGAASRRGLHRRPSRATSSAAEGARRGHHTKAAAMTTPPWGHKPPPVDDPERYWADPPPEVSDRCLYWLRRYFDGTWRPNKRLRAECGECQAEMLGIYNWEAYNLMYPLERAYERTVLGRG